MRARRHFRASPLLTDTAPPAVLVRPARTTEDDVIAGHFLRMWADLGIPVEALEPDGHRRVLAFIAEAREQLAFAAFVGEAGGAIVASASCQFHRPPYPNVFTPEFRRDGYIWGVFVEPAWRRRGLARRLTEATMSHLRGLGCGRAILNASSKGRFLYERMGFQLSNEMRLELR
jgi:GNAT superfamily N-acetyltransferase